MKKAKKIISLLLTIVMILTVIPLGKTNVSAATYEYAMFPGSVLKVTQGAYAEFGNYSHNGQGGFYQNAFDLGGNTNWTAPFSGTITKVKASFNAVVLQSDNEVYWADGSRGYMSVTFVHDNDISNLEVGKHINQGEIFYQSGGKGPSGPNEYSPHLHICVNRGQTNAGLSIHSGDTRPNEAFFLSPSVIIQQTGNYSWKTYTGIPTASYASITEGNYYIKNPLTGTYLGVADNKDVNNANVAIYPTKLAFEIKSSPTTGGYSLRPHCSSTRMLNVYGNTVSKGNNVCIWDNTGHSSQRWYFESVSGGYVIRSVNNPSCVLTIQNGFNVIVSDYIGDPAQVWALEKYCTSHSYKTTSTTKATTTNDGKIIKKCSNCGQTITSIIKKASKISLAYTSCTYNGKTRKPKVYVKDSDGNKISSSNYSVTYSSGRKNVKKYKVTVKLKGKYSGTKNLYFTINPKGTTFKKLKPYKKSVKIYFNKRTTQTSGYQIMHSAHSDFKTCRTKTLWSNKYSSYTCRQVVRKQTYYFKIRTIKEVGNDIYVSGWSKAYKVKTK